MPSKELPYKSALVGEVSSFLESKRRGNDDDDVNSSFIGIIEFIERFKLLPYGLYPVQKFIVKLYYGETLDSKNRTIKISDRLNTKTLYNFTEVEYLKYLYENGRCNIKEQDAKIRRELILCLGRRSGKSALSSIFASYELYKLLRRGHPQSYYGMPSGSEIRVLCVANDKEQASIVYGDMQSHVESVDYFKNSIANTTQTFLKFRTENDKKKFGEIGRGTITATFKSSIAKGLRGRGIICAILDEIAFFVDNGNSSAERVYKAIVPSLAQFSPKEKENKHIPIGPTEGRIILISSPDAREGFFYRQHQLALSNDAASSNMLLIQAPTWEVNPTLSPEYYTTEYYKDPRTFMTEHGAEFSDRVRGWIEDENDLLACLDYESMPQMRGRPKEPHFVGVDLGLVNDGTVVAVTKIENGVIKLVYHEVWYARVPWKEANPHLTDPVTPYARTLQDQARLDLVEIAEWIRLLSNRFYIVGGLFDQWTGIVLEQELHKRGLRQFEMRNFTPNESSQMYQTFKMLMFNRQISLYDYPCSKYDGVDKVAKHSPLVSELLQLQATVSAKNVISVEAPNAPGKHDDMSDALARSVYLASDYLKDSSKYSTLTNSVNSGPRVSAPGYFAFHAAKSRLHGTNRLRTPPKIKRGM